MLIASIVNRLILRGTIFAGRLAGLAKRRQVGLQVVAGGIALALGFWGWMVEKPPTNPSEVLDNVFRTLQLITLQFPNDIRGSPSLLLQIARLAVPLVAAFASFQVLVASVTRPARLALLPYISDHVIVCGSAHLTDGALRTLASRGCEVVVVASQISEGQRDRLEGYGITTLEADALNPATMRLLHVSRASAVFLAGDGDLVNLTIAALALPAMDARPSGMPSLILAIKIERDELADELDTILNDLSGRYGVRYHRLSAAREALRLDLARFAPSLLKAKPDIPSNAIVLGLTGDWKQVAFQLITAMQDMAQVRPILTFAVDSQGEAAVRRWLESTSELDLVVDVTILRAEPGSLPSASDAATWRSKYPTPQLAVILQDDEDAITAAMALRRPGNSLGIGDIPVLVLQSKEDRLLGRLGETQVRHRDMTRLVAIGGLIRAESVTRILDRKGDEAAIALHAHYLELAERVGSSSLNALKAWDMLPESLREANRSAVDHAPILFGGAGYRIKASGQEPIATLSDAELELLAEIEHRRWIVDHLDRGWRLGKSRDDSRMTHPDLISYEALSESSKEKDRNAVRVLQKILWDQGSTIVRRDS